MRFPMSTVIKPEFGFCRQLLTLLSLNCFCRLSALFVQLLPSSIHFGLSQMSVVRRSFRRRVVSSKLVHGHPGCSGGAGGGGTGILSKSTFLPPLSQ